MSDGTPVVEQAQPSYLEMSDEDILKMGTPDFAAMAASQAANPGNETTGEKLADEPVATGSGEGGGEGETGQTEGGEQKTTPAADSEGTTSADTGAEKGVGTTPGEATESSKAAPEQGAASDPNNKKNDETGNKPVAEGAKETSGEPAKVIDYEAEYKRLLAPFKANGRNVQVESVDDAINLMQMGANYNKRMAALKPNLKFMKMLENNNLLDEEKLSFLIDLSKKDAGAIQKLVKDSGIDPMEFDAEKASAYKQSTSYAVDEREIELDTVLDEISSSPTYTRTLDLVSNKWDRASKQAVAQAPQLLKVIDAHMANGIYDLISAEVERERMFGRLQGASDIEAYKAVGDAINARGGFNHLFQKSGAPSAPAGQVQSTPPQPVIVQPKPKVDDTALNDKRRAASPTKPAAPSSTPAEFNPLAMSDEEFQKQAKLHFK